MGGRYWISGVQLGIIIAYLQEKNVLRSKIMALLEMIERNQFLINTENSDWLSELAKTIQENEEKK